MRKIVSKCDGAARSAVAAAVASLALVTSASSIHAATLDLTGGVLSYDAPLGDTDREHVDRLARRRESTRSTIPPRPP